MIDEAVATWTTDCREEEEECSVTSEKVQKT